MTPQKFYFFFSNECQNSKFFEFSQQFWNQCKNLSCFDTKIQFTYLKKKFLGHFSTFMKCWSLIRKKRQKFLKNVFYKSVLELIFKPHHFHKQNTPYIHPSTIAIINTLCFRWFITQVFRIKISLHERGCEYLQCPRSVLCLISLFIRLSCMRKTILCHYSVLIITCMNQKKIKNITHFCSCWHTLPIIPMSPDTAMMATSLSLS